MKRKISSIMCIVLNVLLFNYNSVYALQNGQTTGLREQMYSIPNNNGLFNAGSEIAGYIVYAAIVISVIVLMVKGIKFITSSPEGKADVILVVLNRVWSDKFPDSIEEVIYQKNQFSPVSNGRFDKVEPDEDCWEALLMVEHGWDESQGALYFESESASTWHRNHLQFLFQHGDHMFYTDKE